MFSIFKSKETKVIMNRRNYKTAWKKFVKNNKPAFHNFVQYALCKALSVDCSTQERLNVARGIFMRAFSPITRKNVLDNSCPDLDGWWNLSNILEYTYYVNEMFDKSRSWLPDVVDDEQFKKDFIELKKQLQESIEINSFDIGDYYVYFFVRTDIDHGKNIGREQAVVQAAHTAMVLGNKIASMGQFKDVDPNHTNFIVIEAKSLEDLYGKIKFLNDNKIKYVQFAEPDIGNQITCVATYPINHLAERKKFSKFRLLKFGEPNVQVFNNNEEKKPVDLILEFSII